MEGFYNVYKEKGPSSSRVVMEVKKMTGIKKVGHAGTLDPLAEGVLLVAVGRQFTKTLGEHVLREKEYLADVYLGKVSETDDEEGKKKEIDFEEKPKKNDIDTVLKSFVGEIWQVPPKYSAIKIKGQEAYKRIRRGESFEMPKRKATIFEARLVSYKWPIAKISFVTGSGVYIRSLARDLGEKLGTGAYLSYLKRTRVGDFKIENALKLKQLKDDIFSEKRV